MTGLVTGTAWSRAGDGVRYSAMRLALTPSARWRAVALTAAAVTSLLHAQSPVTLAVAGRGNDAVSVVAQGTFVAVTWGASINGAMDVYSAISRDGGATFTAPVRVNDVPGDARVGGEQPPHLALVPKSKGDPDIVVVWTSKGANGTRLMTARSTDAGARFGIASVVRGTDAAGSRGWESITVSKTGRVFAMWLDHRNLAMANHQMTAPAGGPAMPKPDPVEQAGKSQLYFASLDGGVAPKAITSSVCYCCKTSLVATGDGSVYGVWRHVYPGDLRDMALTVSRNGGRTFAAAVRVSEDHWEFDGCPDNGPSLAVDAARHVHVAWPTPADAKNPNMMALFYAMSRDGKSFAPRVRIPTGGPAGHVQIASEANGSLLVAWEEMANGGRSVKLARGTPDNAGKVDFRRIGTPIVGKYPSIALTPTGAVVAYTQPQGGRNVIVVSRIAR